MINRQGCTCKRKDSVAVVLITVKLEINTAHINVNIQFKIGNFILF